MALQKDSTFNLQGRLDYDWDLGEGFIFSSGLQELYSLWRTEANIGARWEEKTGLFTAINYPVEYAIKTSNNSFTSSAYALVEYASPSGRFGAELGLRLDHLFILGEDFSINTYPVVNPRLNLDFTVLKNRGFIESLTLNAGTGFFSSMADTISLVEKRYGIEDYELRPAGALTSILGLKIEFPGGLSFNIEGYYKHVYHRAYVPILPGPGAPPQVNAYFDGQGRIGGFDLILQKLSSRYWDGWVSYSFTYVQHRDPSGIRDTVSAGTGGGMGGGWYFPDFHRFNYLNLVLNIRPVRRLTISTRLGLAGGIPLGVPEGDPLPYTVAIFDRPGQTVTKFYRTLRMDGHNRTGLSIPLDIKFSVYGFNKKGKVQTETYIAVENALALWYRARGNNTVNPYTGEVNENSDTPSYELPIPMISFGFRWSY
jgi:hypothetical protein